MTFNFILMEKGAHEGKSASGHPGQYGPLWGHTHGKQCGAMSRGYLVELSAVRPENGHGL